MGLSPENRAEFSRDCDVCGRAIPGAEHLVTLKGIIGMCRSCGQNVGSLSGVLQAAASRYLMGNVL
jgi:hypothetical protein